MRFKLFTLFFLLSALLPVVAYSQHSVARDWNETLLYSIRRDFGKPTVQARNIFHFSMAMYDAWAAYDSIAKPYLLGNTVGNYTAPFDGIPAPADVQAAREEAISYASYRMIRHRFQNAPQVAAIFTNVDAVMAAHGYDATVTSTDYASGSPAALGNYIAQQVIAYGLQDGSNEANAYVNQYYAPVNPPVVIDLPGNPDILDLNRWQPITLDVFIDQNGNVIPFNTPPFLTPEWGNVTPFSLTEADKTVYNRNGHDYNVFHDPGGPAQLDTLNGEGGSEEYRWNFGLVSAWSGQMAPNDTDIWDISPASIGNNQSYPTNFAEYQNFYDLQGGGDTSPGRGLNPATGQPYAPQFVPRGDYARVLAEFWADGPNSETPPGHWFTIVNYVNDHPQLVKKYRGEGPVLDDLEWDIKIYFTLSGALHDAAVTAWGIKGWYDGVRPVSAIRGMAEYGQSSDPNLPNYHPAGFPLIPGYSAMVEAGDPLAGVNGEHIGEVKILAWKGPNYIANPQTDQAGVDWILAREWWPYQRPTFVSPPFGGYISGHSTYSRTAAEVLTLFTGSEYFPGGMGEFQCPQNQYLVFEDGPSQNVTLQWATYRDASDQCSLSRIWGGIHPPFDDIPGRLIGMEIGPEAFNYAETYFFADADQDGFLSNNDCNDNNAAVNPGAVEVCDDLDNDCNTAIDENLALSTYYEDVDGDGYGDDFANITTCQAAAPTGYAALAGDCNNQDAAFSPGAAELCDELDNDCDGSTDEDLPTSTYYADVDADGYGDDNAVISSCQTFAPNGYTATAGDCNDVDGATNPDTPEICDGADNNCNLTVDEGLTTYAFYLDSDGDNYGTPSNVADGCDPAVPPAGYVADGTDCNDNDVNTNPSVAEVCDGADNDCTGLADDNLATFSYYLDTDGDGYGDETTLLESCEPNAPANYVSNDQDCNDVSAAINPDIEEVFDGLDNDCNGLVDDGVSATSSVLQRNVKLFPNPTTDVVQMVYSHAGTLTVRVFRADGVRAEKTVLDFSSGAATLSLGNLVQGVYWISAADAEGRLHFTQRVVKM